MLKRASRWASLGNDTVLPPVALEVTMQLNTLVLLRSCWHCRHRSVRNLVVACFLACMRGVTSAKYFRFTPRVSATSEFIA